MKFIQRSLRRKKDRQNVLNFAFCITSIFWTCGNKTFQSETHSIVHCCHDSISLLQTMNVITAQIHASSKSKESLSPFFLDSAVSLFGKQHNDIKTFFQSDSVCIDSLNTFLYTTLSVQYSPYQSSIEQILPYHVLKRKSGSCLGLSLLYLLLAEKYNLPINGIMVPGHFFVQWNDSLLVRNIEPVHKGERKTLDYYRKRYPVSACSAYYYSKLTLKEIKGVVFYSCSTLLLELKMVKEADIFAKAARIVLPEYAEAFATAGIIFSHRTNYDSAEIMFKAATALCPDLENLRYAYGTFLVSRNRTDEALSMYRRELRSVHGHPDLYYACALVHARKKAYDSADFYLHMMEDSLGLPSDKSRILHEKVDKSIK